MRIKLFLLLLLPLTIKAQTVWENQNNEVYFYLNRLSQKGIIDFQNIIQPVSRQNISTLLNELEIKSNQLSEIEKKELHFYQQEFRNIIGEDSANFKLIKKDENKRLRGLYIHDKKFQLNVDPIVSFMNVTGSRKNFTQVSNGVGFWGQAKKFGFQFYYRDYTENGKGMDYFRSETSEPSIIKLNNIGETSQNFSEIKGHVSYTWNNGTISVGKDHLTWGYGENGRIVLSNRAPSYPYVRFDYNPIKGLYFNYINAWLNSNLIDSSLSYPTGIGGGSGELRIQYRPKFMAMHSIIYKPLKGLDISVGESIVYSDKMEIGFLIPINFFKVYDNNKSNYNINAGSNGQLFLQISSRNHLKNTHLYGSLFIDEIRLSQMFNKDRSRNQLGYTIGGTITDAFIPYLTLGGEYTRVNPFVYTNLIAAQSYTQYDLGLGDWMGNNFDREILFVKYTPIAKLRTYIRYQKIRKGGAGTLAQQYLDKTQPDFLFNLQKKSTDIFIQASYEFINNLYLTGSYQYLNHKWINGGNSINTTIQLGITYGLK